MLPLSPEIHSKIASFLLGPSRQDLLSLCLTSKALQNAAEPWLYAQIILPTPSICLAVCTTLSLTPRLAQHVRRFVYAPEGRNARLPAAAAQTFWTTLQNALEQMGGLDTLVLSDASFEHSWVLGSPALPTRIRELRIRTGWDAHTVSFVLRQQELRLLQVYDAIDDPAALLSRSVTMYLPKLETFDSTLTIGMQFTSCGIRHMQLVVDCESTAALGMLGRLVGLRGSLRALSLLDTTEEMAVPIVELVSRILPDLRHIGFLMYPMTSRHLFHKYLLRMHYLQVLELNLSRWNPLPTPTAAQRVLADELRVFCPSLRVITFWVNGTRTRWAVNHNHSHNANANGTGTGTGANGAQPPPSLGMGYGQWQSRSEQGMYPPMGELWRML